MIVFLHVFCVFSGDIIDSVFEKASQKKAWDQFTKPQRKTIGQWKESAQELRKELSSKLNDTSESIGSGNEESETEPPTKKMKADIGMEYRYLCRCRVHVNWLYCQWCESLAIMFSFFSLSCLFMKTPKWQQGCPEQ